MAVPKKKSGCAWKHHSLWQQKTKLLKIQGSYLKLKTLPLKFKNLF